MIFWANDGYCSTNSMVTTGPFYHDTGWNNSAAAKRYQENLGIDVLRMRTAKAIEHGAKFVYPISLRHHVRDPQYALDHGVARLGWLHPRVLKAVRDGQAVLLLDDTHEGFPDVERIQLKFFDQLCTAFNLPPKRVVWWTGNVLAPTWETPETVRIVSEDCQFWHIVCCEYNAFPEKFDALVHPLDKPKRYLAYNRHWNETRQFFVLDLYQRNLLQHGLVSLGCAPSEDLAHRFLRPEFFTNWEETDEKRRTSCKAAHRLQPTLPLIIDTDLSENLSHTFVTEHYLQTDLSVINETWSSPTTMFISEKTYKTILFKHPFMVLSSPGFMAYVRSLGFQTFHPIINEAYDEEPALPRRKELLLAELLRWINLKAKDRRKALEQLREITEFNYRLLLTQRKPGERLGPVLKELLA